jgi:ABC-type glycerol-3-phosphate transport system permease component
MHSLLIHYLFICCAIHTGDLASHAAPVIVSPSSSSSSSVNLHDSPTNMLFENTNKDAAAASSAAFTTITTAAGDGGNVACVDGSSSLTMTVLCSVISLVIGAIGGYAWGRKHHVHSYQPL